MTTGWPITCVGLAEDVRDLVIPRAARAVDNLGLRSDIGALMICADDVAGDDDAWYALTSSDAGSGLPSLVLYCHQDSFGPLRAATSTVFPPRTHWEQSAGPYADPILASADFASLRADIFVHHHLLTARDLVRGALDPQDIPAGLAESFAALWAVGVDGRLERSGWPGYSMADRRGRFSRLFASAGILMPEHWQAFQTLWDGALGEQRDVLGLVRHLPRL